MGLVGSTTGTPAPTAPGHCMRDAAVSAGTPPPDTHTHTPFIPLAPQPPASEPTRLVVQQQRDQRVTTAGPLIVCGSWPCSHVDAQEEGGGVPCVLFSTCTVYFGHRGGHPCAHGSKPDTAPQVPAIAQMVTPDRTGADQKNRLPYASLVCSTTAQLCSMHLQHIKQHHTRAPWGRAAHHKKGRPAKH